MANRAFEILHEKNVVVGLCSRGIAKIDHLDLFLQTEAASFQSAKSAADADIFIGWGNKRSGQKAMEFAAQANAPFLLLEDAFIRSHAPHSVSNEQALGLVLDDQGIYYDADKKSRLETLILQNRSNTASMNSGRTLIEHFSYNQISKYNNFDPDRRDPEKMLSGTDNILVIDQTWRDQSVSGAGATDQTFTQMMEAAIDENPGRKIIVKLHPEVLAGKKQGYLKDLALKENCTLLAANINPWHLFRHIHTVYTVSSQLGFDALLAGCKVRCFAMPFYAGWGLTSDETVCDRRKKANPDLSVIADAAYTRYARYKSAYDPVPCDVFETVNQIVQIRDAHNQNQNIAAIYQVTPWKWQRVRQMFSPTTKGRTFFLTRAAAINVAKKTGGALVAWASRIDTGLEQACTNEGVSLHRLEDGFIRSVGLGTNFHLPMSLILDDRGIYYDSTRTSQLEHILESHAFQATELKRAEKLIKSIVESKISKYNLSESQTITDLLPQDRQIILVPGQVDDDASIRFGGNNMTSSELLSKARNSNPDAFIIFKPHPDVVSGQRPGLHNQQRIMKFADLTAPQVPINQLIAISDQVHTISSLTGFEALLRNKEVHCYGMPFYAGWGLTTDHTNCNRRTRKLSLEMLVSGTLIKYPRYYDPVSKLACGPEQIIKRINQQRAHPTSTSLLIRCRTVLGKLRRYIR